MSFSLGINSGIKITAGMCPAVFCRTRTLGLLTISMATPCSIEHEVTIDQTRFTEFDRDHSLCYINDSSQFFDRL